MKKDSHPKNYRPVVFHDVGADESWICRSTVKTERTTTIDGTEYPLYTLEISNVSHPFYTGKQRFVDTEGRVDRFNKKYTARPKAPAKPKPVAKAEAKPAAKAKAKSKK